MKKSLALFGALVMVIAVVAVVRQLPSYNFEPTDSPMKTVELSVGTNPVVSADDNEKSASTTDRSNGTNAVVSQANQLEQSINSLKDCYEQPDACGYPDDDPRMQSYLIGQDYKAALQNAAVLAQAGDLSFQQASDLALNALSIPDGHVQFAALEVIEQLDADPQFIFPILDMVVDSHDAKVTELALSVLSKQPTAGYETQIDETLSATMTHGAPFVSEQVAKSILPFLSEQNIDRYVDLLLEIPSETATHRMLDVMVEEYALMQMGG